MLTWNHAFSTETKVNSIHTSISMRNPLTTPTHFKYAGLKVGVAHRK